MGSGAALKLPAQGDAEAVLARFYPRGPVPGDPHAATLHAFAAQLDAGGPVPLAEFDALRKQAGNKARALSRGVGESDPTAAAAWGALKELFDGQEVAAIARSERLRPTGQGPHGPIFGGLTGDADNAVAHLLRMQTGEVPGALSHRQVQAPIDLVHGVRGSGESDGFGLAKLEASHPEALQDLQGLLNRTTVRPEASGANRLRMAGPNGEDAVVSLNWRGDPKTWLLSAFERNPESARRSMNLPGALGEGAAASTPAALGASLPNTAGLRRVLPTPPGVFGPDWQEAQRLLAAAEQMKSMPAIAEKYRGMAQVLLDKMGAAGVDTAAITGKAAPAPAIPVLEVTALDSSAEC